MFKWLMLIVYIILGTYMLWRMIHWFKIVIPLFKHKRIQALWIGLYCIFASTIFLGGVSSKKQYTGNYSQNK